MTIDLSTIVSLELIQNLQNAKSKDSLFGLLNETLTPMGARLLRANILQPSTEQSKLLARYDAVEDLSTKEEMFISVRQGLFKMANYIQQLTLHSSQRVCWRGQSLDRSQFSTHLYDTVYWPPSLFWFPPNGPSNMWSNRLTMWSCSRLMSLQSNQCIKHWWRRKATSYWQ